MPTLILLNGPPGIGKPTLADIYIQRHPGALNLDIDRLRTMVGGWAQTFVLAGEIVRPLALQMAATHLNHGRTVIVPQYLASASEVDAFQDIARDAKAGFLEVVLMSSQDHALTRYSYLRDQPDALRSCINEVIDTSGGNDYLCSLYDDLVSAVNARPNAVVIDSLVDDITGTFTLLTRALDDRSLSDPAG